MATVHAPILTIARIEAHPNADLLEIAWVRGYSVVVRKGEFQVGEQAVYIPVDAILPKDGPLGERFTEVYKYTANGRVFAAKMRGIFSIGMLWKLDGLTGAEGDNVATALGLTKHEEVLEDVPDALPDPGFMPKYHIQELMMYPGVLTPGEEVVITEKLNGANGRWCWHEGQFWIGSRNYILDPDGDNLWARVARKYDLSGICQDTRFHGYVFYGEVLGMISGMRYGFTDEDPGLRIFDCYRIGQGWIDYYEFRHLVTWDTIPAVPHLYSGAWNPSIARSMAEGSTELELEPFDFVDSNEYHDRFPDVQSDTLGAAHTREGVVIRPTRERWDPTVGRVIFKLPGEMFLLREEKQRAKAKRRERHHADISGSSQS